MGSNAEFWVWLAVVLTILGGGMGTMVLAYRRPLQNLALFDAPVEPPSLPLGDVARGRFERGCGAYQQGKYAEAIDGFIAVLQAEPACAEAFHNCGLAYANLGSDDLAVRALLKAETCYDQQGTRPGIDLIKAQLKQIAARRQGLATQVVDG